MIIYLVTDSDDNSSVQVDDVVSELKALKGKQSVHVVAFSTDSKSKCFNSVNYDEPNGLKSLVKQTSGTFVDLCGPSKDLLETTLSLFYK